jgi:flagella basal body P-ring formation protein FlgA
MSAALLAGVLFATAAWADDGREAPAAPSGAPIRIELAPDVEVKQRPVALGDVARVSTRDAAVLRRLVALPLGQAPRAGDGVRLERNGLMRWIRARTGIDTRRIEWSGSSACDIRLAERDLPGEAVARQATEALRSALSQGGARVEVSVSRMPRDTRVPAGELELRARPVPKDAILSKRVSVWVDVWVDGRFARTVPVGFEVSVFGRAYVATQRQPAGEILEPSKLAVQEVEWSGRNALPIAATAMRNMRLRRPLEAGDAVTRAQVEPAPLVARGDWVTLRASQGLVVLESRVEALQDGLSGQTVRVKLPNASSAILARVTGPRMVEMQQ